MFVTRIARKSVMKLARIILIFSAPLIINACGSNIEWFPSVPDTTPPTVSAKITYGSTDYPIFSNHTTHVPALPVNVLFSVSNEPATIYYTTNGSNPTTSSSSVALTSSSWTTGPAISVTDTTLKFFGTDKANNNSATITGIIKSP
jgi:hypothetical protein